MHLITEAAMELHKHNFKVSVALHANQFLFKEVYEYVDQVNLMAYDMVVPNSNEHHASFINGEWKKMIVRNSIKKFIRMSNKK